MHSNSELLPFFSPAAPKKCGSPGDQFVVCWPLMWEWFHSAKNCFRPGRAGNHARLGVFVPGWRLFPGFGHGRNSLRSVGYSRKPTHQHAPAAHFTPNRHADSLFWRSLSAKSGSPPRVFLPNLIDIAGFSSHSSSMRCANTWAGWLGLETRFLPSQPKGFERKTNRFPSQDADTHKRKPCIRVVAWVSAS